MIGKTISHYKILEKLGEGGMGVVYKAEDTKLKRTVALKFLPPELTRDKEAKDRFIHEARAAAALDHPNICNVFEIDETEDGQMYIAMACYEGETLKEKIEKGPLKLDEAIDIAIQVAQGLERAHESNIIHRDIKSANIIITKDGVAKILDFGLAKLKGHTKLTKDGTTLGTAAYMSPEQSQGKKVDHRTDIWALGVVLYEMVTGQLPFKGDYEQAIVYSIMNEEPEPVTAIRTGVPMELESIVNKALAKSPLDRYQHVDEIPVDLKGVQSNLIVGRTISIKSTTESTGRASNRAIPIRSKFKLRSLQVSIAIALLAFAAIVFFWSQVINGLPVIVLMDSPIPGRVYDPETRANHGTNADDITDILRDLPVVLHKETVTSSWHREDQVLKQNPALVIVHRSCFYDGSALGANLNSTLVEHIYTISEGRLIAFLGYVALANPETKFLVYSRGFKDGSHWVAQVENRFSRLRGKVVAMTVPGGGGPTFPGEPNRSKATFRAPETVRQTRALVLSILNLKEDD